MRSPSPTPTPSDGRWQRPPTRRATGWASPTSTRALFEGAGVAKRELVDYLDAVRDRILPVLRQRPLSVIRATGGQAPFMQKNLPKYTPEWVARVDLWAEASKRTVSYALCDDRRTLLWFANQRAVEYHPTLSLADHLDRPTHLVLDLDPPEGAGFPAAAAAAHLVRRRRSTRSDSPAR